MASGTYPHPGVAPDHLLVGGDGVDVRAWRAEVDRVEALVGGRFGRVEPRRWAGAYLRGLLAPLERKNGWTLAEYADAVSPDGHAAAGADRALGRGWGPRRPARPCRRRTRRPGRDLGGGRDRVRQEGGEVRRGRLAVHRHHRQGRQLPGGRVPVLP